MQRPVLHFSVLNIHASAAMALLLLAAFAAPASAQRFGPERATPWRVEGGPPGEVVVALGRFDAIRGTSATSQAELAYRPELDVAGFRPEVGMMVTSESSTFVHFAVGRELPVGGLLVVRPSLGVGSYRAGSGKDLGRALEFRSAIELSVRAFGGGRIGVELYHLSNAHLSDRNPGEESVVATFSLPLRLARRAPVLP